MTIFPQLVFNVIILFFEDLFTFGIDTFFSRCATADVSLHTTFTAGGAASAIVENPAVKITKVATTDVDFVIFLMP
jgi:hypothetical protein